MYEAILYLLNVRILELKKKHAKQFKSGDVRKLDKIEKEINDINLMIKIIVKST